MNQDILGVDFGGVITDRAKNDGSDTSFFSDNFLKTSAVYGVFEALRRLVDGRFRENIHIVSTCGKVIQNKTLLWLDYHYFYELTGVREDHVHFCRKRSEKAGICKDLGITHFVDDHMEVLSHLVTVGTLYLFQPRTDDIEAFAGLLNRVVCVNSWLEIANRELPHA